MMKAITVYLRAPEIRYDRQRDQEETYTPTYLQILILRKSANTLLNILNIG